MQTQFLPQKDISLGRIVSLFESVFIEIVSVDRTGDSFFCKELGWTFDVLVEKNKQMITFRCMLNLDRDASEFRKLRFANQMSQRFILVNVLVFDEKSLAVEYQLPYTGGIVFRALYNSFKHFVNISKTIGSELVRKKLVVRDP